MPKRKKTLKARIIENLKIPALAVAACMAIASVMRYWAKWDSVFPRLEAGEVEREGIKEWIKRQQYLQEEQSKINEYYYQKEKKKNIIISRDGKWYWNKELGKWRPIKELQR